MATSGNHDRQRCVSNDDSGITSEIELLKEIYINEFEIDHNVEEGIPYILTLLLHPATGENTEQQFVYLTLVLTIPIDYPECSPGITIKNSRGLADEHISSIRESLTNLAKERKGSLVLYELIEMAKESLTKSNVPHGQCVICMQRFDEADHFMKTECYHFFHGYCLLQYINHSLSVLKQQEEEWKRQKLFSEQKEQTIVCPVCREPISYDLDVLQSAEEPNRDHTDVYKPTEAEYLQQQHFAKMYERQKMKGGIIDVEAERNRFLISSVISQSENVSVMDIVHSDDGSPEDCINQRSISHDSKSGASVTTNRYVGMQKDFILTSNPPTEKSKSQVKKSRRANTECETDSLGSINESSKDATSIESNKFSNISSEHMTKQKNARTYFNRPASSGRYRSSQHRHYGSKERNENHRKKTPKSTGEGITDAVQKMKHDNTEENGKRHQGQRHSQHRHSRDSNRPRSRNYERKDEYHHRDDDRYFKHSDSANARHHNERSKEKTGENRLIIEKSTSVERASNHYSETDYSKTQKEPVNSMDMLENSSSTNEAKKMQASKESASTHQKDHAFIGKRRTDLSNQQIGTRRGRGHCRGQRPRDDNDMLGKFRNSDKTNVDITSNTEHQGLSHEQSSCTKSAGSNAKHHGRSKNTRTQCEMSESVLTPNKSSIAKTSNAMHQLNLNDDNLLMKSKPNMDSSIRPPPGFKMTTFPSSDKDM